MASTLLTTECLCGHNRIGEHGGGRAIGSARRPERAANVEESATLFNAVFFVVIVSALAQGLTLEPLARRLGLAGGRRPAFEPPLELDAIRALGGEILEVEAGAAGEPTSDADPGKEPVASLGQALGLPRRQAGCPWRRTARLPRVAL